MKPPYVFSLLAVAATVAAFAWHPKPPRPETSTREEDGFEVRITRHAEPNRFEALPVPSLNQPDLTRFNLPRSYVAAKLCAGDEVMLAQVQGHLLLGPGEGTAYGELVSRCTRGAPFCARAAAALTEDAGLSVDELSFFAAGVLACDWAAFSELRTDLRLPLDLRLKAWTGFNDGGSWSPELGALVDEVLVLGDGGAQPLRSWQLSRSIKMVRSEHAELLDASVRLMNWDSRFAALLRDAASPRVKALACARVDCPDEPDSGVDPREELAACALRLDDSGYCIDRLAALDWPMAHLVALRLKSDSSWNSALRAFETREAFNAFARSVSAHALADGGFLPEALLGDLDEENFVDFYSQDGLGHDELAAQWSRQAPELENFYFIEEAEVDGGVRLSGRLGDDLYAVGVRREKVTLDARVVLALLNVIVAERGSARRFFFSEVGPTLAVHFAAPALVSSLKERGLIVLGDPDVARKEDWD
ncbi:MAG: hypothetical protein Q8N23_02060 [Archangium sp.]|nr:hypothetical protein [Archangium sp.]MDP3151424.1 hypothetical protein [Archangium sp.]MDP3575316.1 hypothetical protein [Archangium sp.]